MDSSNVRSRASPARSSREKPRIETLDQDWVSSQECCSDWRCASRTSTNRNLFAPVEPPSFQRLTFRRGDVTSAKFAPGDIVVYSAEWDGAPSTLFSAQPGNREARPLSLPSARVLAISQRGEMAILLGGEDVGTLARVPVRRWRAARGAWKA